MIARVLMPQGGQDIEKGTLVRWHRGPGDAVRKGEPLCDVETEKTVIEVGAPQDGILLATYLNEGEDAAVFSVIAIVGDPGDSVPEASAPPASSDAASPHTASIETSSRRAQRSPRPGRPLVTPRARRLAEERGVDLEGVVGTGPQGSITAADVLNAEVAPSGAPQGAPIAGGRVVPMTKVGKVTARRMSLSKQTVPHFYVTASIDMTAAKAFRAERNAHLAASGQPALSLTDLIARACALALREVPQLNCTVKDEGNLILWDEVHIGIATATDGGLMVPVLEDADRRSLEELSREARLIVQAAREGRQTSTAPAHFTISNLGMFGVDSFAAIINPPETAILSVAAVKPTVLPAQDGTLQVREIMNVTLSMDHRAGDGILAARFLSVLREILEAPDRLG